MRAGAKKRSWRSWKGWGLLITPVLVAAAWGYSQGFLDNRTSLGPNSVYGVSGMVTGPPRSAVKIDQYDGGWGPSRDTFTTEEPAPYAVLNSITDNPAQGDERNSVQVRDLKTADSLFGELAEACPGQEVEVFFYFENDVADNLSGPPATIHGLTEAVLLGGQGTTRVNLGILLSAKNAASVWDGAAVGCSSSKIRITYIPGSARLFTWSTPKGGAVLPDSGFVADGSGLIGSKGATGELPVGQEKGHVLGAGYVTFRMLATTT